MSKAKNKIRVSFVGENARDVTGSMTHINTSFGEFLLECGLYQSNSPREDYKINSAKFPFRPRNIKYIFLNHVHIDHSGRIPALYAQGCNGRIICPRGTKDLFRILALDSAYIIGRDCEWLNKTGMKATPFYKSEDVYTALDHMDEYDFGEVIELSPTLSFRFVSSGHIINSAQLELWITEGNQTKKILYTSDLGSSIPKYYITPFESVLKANLAICESTYSDDLRNITFKDRETDLAKIKTVVQNVCISQKGKVLFPTFSLDRTQNILTFLYEMFADNKDFHIPILIDSPLAIKVTAAYLRLLPEDDRRRLERVLTWDNVRIVKDFEESLRYQQSNEPMIILAASGFMQAGRSRTWVKTILPQAKSHIVFIGFATPGSLAGKLKTTSAHTITIDKRRYACRCGITNLHSFSSHIQYGDMLKYYSDIQCDKLCLVHGEYKSKRAFAKRLQDEISRKNKTNKVIVANKSTSLLI